MAIRVQNLPKKNFNHASVLSTPHFGVTYPPWWNLNEQQIPPSVPKSSTSKEESPTQLHLQGKHLGLQFGEPESSSTQSAGNSSHEVSVMGGANSQDQSISSESGQDESCARSVEGQTKPVFLFNNPEIIFNTAQADQGHPMVRVPYATVDPYFGGLLTPYGPQAIVQPQMGSQIVGMGPARVPLPLNLAEDGPIYVNAKQYHGILRRRQSRAKMEAQNKLVKTRKPYLHESRHIHALNRVRGSGGRFLSTKKLQQVDPALSNPNPCAAGARDPSKSTSELETHHTGASEKHFTSTVTNSSITSLSSHDAFCSDGRFSGLTMHMGGGVQCNGGLLHSSATQHCSSSVR